jgi:toxin FitB
VGFLLDTNVVSELRKSRPDQNVVTWSERERDTEVYISVLAVGEIRQGIERVRRRDETQATALNRWLETLLSTYRDRVLPITTDITEEWGRIGPAAQPLPVIDGLMVATARVHRLTLVTRNTQDVSQSGVQVVNPFDP